MVKDQAYNLLLALDDFLVDNGYKSSQGEDINEYPRVEVYISTSGQQIDKGDNSRPVDIVFDVITESRDQFECMAKAEALQNDLIVTPVVVDDFDIDIVTVTGLTPLTEESSSDNRTINRILINYTYNLTQTIF